MRVTKALKQWTDVLETTWRRKRVKKMRNEDYSTMCESRRHSGSGKGEELCNPTCKPVAKERLEAQKEEASKILSIENDALVAAALNKGKKLAHLIVL